MPEPGELFAHRYRLERLLARGGMGSVWVAHDERLVRAVAVKFMDPAMASSDELKARFRREASAAGALRTRHVVQVHDFGVEDDTPYIVMEMLEGEDLGARLSRVRRLSVREASALGVQIARGLRHAHDAGIVHRDLKPQNLFLCREDDGEIVKILDFGVAKRTGLGAPLGDATTTKQLLGSPQFMSPEQTRARGVDHRSDVWALGVILYRMLTGKLPFQSEHVIDLMVRIQSEPHPPPSSVDPALAPLDSFFDRALAKEADDRFSTAVELASALAQHAGLAGGSSLDPTPPPGPLPTLGPTFGGHPSGSAGSGSPTFGGARSGSPTFGGRPPSGSGGIGAGSLGGDGVRVAGAPSGAASSSSATSGGASFGATPHPSLIAVPLPPSGATPAPTPMPRTGATPMPGSVYGMSPPSLRPATAARLASGRVPTIAAVAGAVVATALITIVVMVAAAGDETSASSAATAPALGAAPRADLELPTDQASDPGPSTAVSPTAGPRVAGPVASEHPEPGAPSASALAPELPSAASAPASASAPAPASASAPAIASSTAPSPPMPPRASSARPPPPKPSGEKKLLLTY